MIESLAIIIVLGLTGDVIFKKIKLPGLVAMLLIGIVIGPYLLNLLNNKLINISADIRMIALIIILLRAGLELKRSDIKKVGTQTILLSMIPAIFECIIITLLAPILLGISYLEAAILGAILGAVSPAVVVPMMIDFIEKKKGTKKGIPSLIIGASSIDDIFVIVIFTILLGMYQGNDTNILLQLLEIPESILLGIIIGIVMGYILYKLFQKFPLQATKITLLTISVALFLAWLEQELKSFLPIASLLAVMTLGFILVEKSEEIARSISRHTAKIWILGEIFLFVLVGTQVNIETALHAGFFGLIIITIGLIGRSIGTYLCLMGSNLDIKEKFFVVISYLPKATVQAAIGAIPLEMGVKSGDTILAIAVLSIIFTAPLGAIGIKIAGDKFLKVDDTEI